MLPFGRLVTPASGAWDACVACDFAFPARCCEWLQPCGRTISPSGGVWDACAACDFAYRPGVISICCPAGALIRPPAELGTPARRAARWGRLWGCAPFSAPLASPPKHPLQGLSKFLSMTRATRHLLRELPSLAPRAQVISLRAALMPESAFASVKLRFSQQPLMLLLAQGMPLYPSFSYFRTF